MSSFWQLVKINLASIFAGGFNIEANGKKKRTAMYLLIGFALIYSGGIFGYAAYTMGVSLAQISMQKILIVFAFLAGSAMVFIQVFFSSFNLIFKAKDYEQLACLPIKQSTIILSKITSFLIYCYAFSFLFFAPIAIFYFVFTTFSFVGLIFTILGFLLLPLFPMFIGLLFSFLINSLTVRFKYKNFINIILFFTIFFVIFFFSQNIDGFISNIATNSQSTFQTMTSIYFPNIFISKAIINADILNFAYYVLVSVVPIGILIWLFSKFYKKFYSFFSQSAKQKVVLYTQTKRSKSYIAIMKKEFSRIFSSPMILFNNCIGPIMLVVLGIMFLFGVNMEFAGIGNGFAFLIVIIPTINLIATPTSTTFSLEGDGFWQLKSFPISVYDIVLGKILASVIIFAVPNVLGIILISIGLKLAWFEILLTILLSASSIILSAFVGITINLHKFNIHWKNEIAVVKQSSSVLINLVIGFAISLIPGILILSLFKDYVTTLILCGVLIVLYAVAILVLIKYLKQNGKKLFDKIN